MDLKQLIKLVKELKVLDTSDCSLVFEEDALEGPLTDFRLAVQNLEALEFFSGVGEEFFSQASFPNLQRLYIESNHLSNLKSQLPQLRLLHLVSHGEVYLPNAVYSMPLLEILDLSYFRFREGLPQEFSTLQNLKELILPRMLNKKYENQNTRQISSLENLDSLSMPAVYPSKAIDIIHSLNQLKSLKFKFSDKYKKELWAAIAQLSNIEKIESTSGLYDLPETIQNLTKLRETKLFAETQKSLDRDILLLKNCVKLDRLTITLGNHQLPLEISQLSSVKCLNISHTGDKMPDNIRVLIQHPNLEELSIRIDKQAKKTLQTIVHLPMLRVLYLQGLTTVSLAELLICLQQIISLEMLHIDHYRSSSFLFFAKCYFPNLKCLSIKMEDPLSKEKVNLLIEQITSSFPKLEELSLPSVSIFPASFNKLSFLKKLDISSCGIKGLESYDKLKVILPDTEIIYTPSFGF